MTEEELQEWECLYQLDPWGTNRNDLRFAQLAWMMAKNQSLTVYDFMTHYYKELYERPAIDIADIDHVKLKEEATAAIKMLDSFGANNA